MSKTRIIQIRIDEELDDVVEYLKTQPGGLSWWIRDKLSVLRNCTAIIGISNGKVHPFCVKKWKQCM